MLKTNNGHFLVAPLAPAGAPAVANPVANQAAPVEAPIPAEVPHLASPENLPPGTAPTPQGPNESGNVTYLKEIWHAIRTQEISGSDALLALTQRPLTTTGGGPAAMAPVGAPPAPAAPLAGAPAPLPAPGLPVPGAPAAPMAAAPAPLPAPVLPPA